MAAKSQRNSKSRAVKTSFTVDDYIGALIKSINDDAGKARTAGLAMLLTGLYLVGTVIATTDEAMLRGASRDLPQLGIALPVVISYALAPPIFLFLHISTLILFERVGEKLAHYDAQIDARKLGGDRAHYDALLTTTNFIQTYFHKRNGRQTGWITRAMSWFSVTFFPLLILLAVQVDFIRYQHEIITSLHQGATALDVAVLGWFYWSIREGSARSRISPNDLPSAKENKQLRIRLKRLLYISNSIPERSIILLLRAFKVPGYWVPALFVLWIGLGHAVVPEYGTKDAKTVGRNPSLRITINYRVNGPIYDMLNHIWGRTNLLDSAICPALNRGCRYLRLANRENLFTIADRARVIADVEDRLSGGPEIGRSEVSKIGKKDPFRQVEGLDLRERNLRFADFTESKLYKAILIGADLRGAALYRSWLPKSDMRKVRLNGAILRGARLQGADLQSAQLRDSNLIGAQLQGANLNSALLQGTSLRNARLQGASLNAAQLQGADMRWARLQGARLHGAMLQGVDLIEANLQGTDLNSTRLQGADLRSAQLQGANLAGAQLQGANLRKASLQGVNLKGAIVRSAMFSGAVFRYADLRRVKRGKIVDVDLTTLDRGLTIIQVTVNIRQRILAVVKKRRTQPDDLEKADTMGAYCFDDKLTTQLNTCKDYRFEDTYFETVIFKVLRPLACNTSADPAIGRGLVLRDKKWFNIKWAPGALRWRIAEMLLNEKCAGHKHLTNTMIARMMDVLKRHKPKTPAVKK